MKKVKKGRKKKKATKKSQRANESHSFLRPRTSGRLHALNALNCFFFSLTRLLVHVVIIKLCEEQRTRAQQKEAEVVSYRALLAARASFFPFLFFFRGRDFFVNFNFRIKERSSRETSTKHSQKKENRNVIQI